MASLSTHLELLLDDCRSEAKRWNSGEAGLIHLAYVLSRRDPDTFASRFGTDAHGNLEAMLKRGDVGPEAPTLLAVLEAAPTSEPSEHLFDALEAAFPDLDRPPPTPEAGPDQVTATAGDRTEEAGSWELPSRAAHYVTVVAPDPSIYIDRGVIGDILACIGRRTPTAPLVVARSGAGRTSLITALANVVGDSTYHGPLAGTPVVRVRPDALIAGDRANALRRILEDFDTPVIAAIDDVEVVVGLGNAGVDLDMLGVLRAAIESPNIRVVLTMDVAFEARLAAQAEELSNEVERIALPTMARDALDQVVARTGAELASFHGVELDDSIARLALAPAAASDRLSHPGLALARLDGACARAATAGRPVEEGDLRLGDTPEIARPNAAALAADLRRHVVGQDLAVTQVSERLALTRAELDLRSDRPDGVFLFVGPTGVGKTELARAIAREVGGSEELLIRLDMSEYAHDWALSRLIGPQPGYVGYTEPESWLTTKIRRTPAAVLLLDEIEKAHPAVWNAFLQVFDAGRLSDARGAVADFSSVIVCMTSNLGAKQFSATPLGFTPQADDRSREIKRVVDAVEDAMAPELVNRLDGIIVFEPLDRTEIRHIAAKEVATAIEMLADRGYELKVPDAVIDLVADRGYDPTYGARHLQRNIERLLLQPLSAIEGRELAAVVDGDAVTWLPA